MAKTKGLKRGPKPLYKVPAANKLYRLETAVIEKVAAAAKKEDCSDSLIANRWLRETIRRHR